MFAQNGSGGRWQSARAGDAPRTEQVTPRSTGGCVRQGVDSDARMVNRGTSHPGPAGSPRERPCAMTLDLDYLEVRRSRADLGFRGADAETRTRNRPITSTLQGVSGGPAACVCAGQARCGVRARPRSAGAVRGDCDIGVTPVGALWRLAATSPRPVQEPPSCRTSEVGRVYAPVRASPGAACTCGSTDGGGGSFGGKPTRTAGARRRGAEAARQPLPGADPLGWRGATTLVRADSGPELDRVQRRRRGGLPRWPARAGRGGPPRAFAAPL
jgi:hypothetical protein